MNYTIPKTSPATIHMAPWWSRCPPCINSFPKAGTPHKKNALQRRIEATDGQIDALVYELYGLTEEEIGIVETTGR